MLGRRLLRGQFDTFTVALSCLVAGATYLTVKHGPPISGAIFVAVALLSVVILWINRRRRRSQRLGR